MLPAGTDAGPPPGDGAAEPLRQARQAVSAILARTQTLYDSSPLMYLLLDGEGAIMDGNRRALQGLGRPAAEVLGQRFEDLLHEDSRGPLRAALLSLGERQGAGELPAVELQLQGAAGDLFTSATLTATRAADGTPVEVHVMMLDISEVRRLQKRMLQADRLASVGQLAAGVAHEINNPASWVITDLTYLQERLPLLAGLRGRLGDGEDALAAASLLLELPQLCQKSLDGMRRISKIVKDLQLFAREPRQERERLDLNELCDTVSSMAWHEIRNRARFEKCYGAPPPLLGDSGRLSQVLLNLLINAAQAIQGGDPAQHKIVVTTTAREGGALVTVRDTGCGIPKAVLGRIFDPFFTTKPPGKGTGLGLSVSHEIIASHGGRIEVESEVGAGTTFSIWLPAAPAAEAEARADGPRVSAPGKASAQARANGPGKAAEAPAPPRVPGKVLVIDDEPELLRALERTLRPAHQVILAGSGREGYEQLRAHRDIDVVLCDVNMPDKTGMDLYESLPLPLRDRFIFMSGDTASAVVHAFLGSVKGPHLQKPVEPRDLLAAVSEAVQRRRGASA